ncbi:BglG family transcription antiterminator [Paenibacillus sp. UMB7766-LJ446]|uniref:BglG family transcription antiterminator n=1 Tax=unclassified Paenibacillus TaxID=185978 RepID=UPI0009A2CFDC|nr:MULTISPECIES: BglG family transcription antiterminator [unclassified Paenibacillus]MDK8192717.1 BglG family transcription antiterminator [Paenibacillus sp. UMB7766-LJ446]MDN8588680.1 BglG family transcription antiterminator [Paenibacillus sp. 11B]OPG94501.1 transcriptional antiterminator [Chryseobacterium mucoviscidosis]
MSNITRRQREIVEFLLEHPHEVTAGEIAVAVKVSTRTVHRELQMIEQWLEPLGMRLEKKSGTGVRIDPGSDDLAVLRQQLELNEYVEFTPEERKLFMLCILLDESEPVKLLALASDLKVTVSTASNDLDDLEPRIHLAGLKLVRRRGYGVKINGSEWAHRMAISALALEYLDESDLFGRQAEQGVSKVNSKLLEMIGHEDVLTVENALWQPDIEWLENIPERQYMKLLIQMSVAVVRIRKGFGIGLGSQLDKKDVGNSLQGDKGKVPEYLASRLCGVLSAQLGIDFVDEEQAYFHRLLIEIERSIHSSRLLPIDDLVLLNMVRSLTDRMQENTHYSFHEDRLLREGLIAHMEPVLERMDGRQLIRNPLLQQIRKDYESLFEDVKKAVREAWPNTDVPDEEIGFLVMHFGASIERLRVLKREIRAVVVCTSGIGSSRMLSSRLSKEIPEIRIVDSVSWYEAARIPKTEYDLVLSTVDLPMDKHQYYKVSPLLTAEESERLRHFIRTTTLQREHSPPPEAESRATGRFTDPVGLEATLIEIVQIIGKFQVFPLDNQEIGFFKTAYAMCSVLHQSGVLNNPEEIARLLEEREEVGSQKIPGTSLALFHTRSDGIHSPSITLFQLTEPLLRTPEDPAGVSHVLLMLGPRQLSKESLEVLSEISALLLQEEMIALLEKGNRDDLIHYLSQELAGFYRSKTEIGGIQT